ncbi:MAG: NADH-quinone oxidoreductase subunit C [Candidatus Bathyarchaeia archaeon]
MSEKIQQILNGIREELADSTLKVEITKYGRPIVYLKPEANREAIKRLLKAGENPGIVAVTGLDSGLSIDVLSHFRVSGRVITLKCSLPRDNPEINTISDILPGAELHEREVMDLLGVAFKGHPNPERLILPDNWPIGVYPLRKDVDEAKLSDVLGREKNHYTEERDLMEGNVVKLIIGPQHPALIEPEKFILEVNGEVVVKVKPRIGYVHRGIEKAAERRTYIQDIYLMERICGICNVCHATCFCQTVEELLGLNIPSRAKYLRTIILELNRIHSHMLLLGHTGLEMGFETFFHYMWRDREPIMDVIEMLTGNRVLTSYITIGGVRRDIEDKMIPIIKKELKNLRDKIPFYRDVLENDPTVKLRTKNVGVLTKEDALKLCVVGPVARASGIKMDVRKDEPYAAYDEIPFNIIVYDEGDSWARLMVRLDEINESINIIEYALDHLPTGPYRVRAPRIVPEGETIGRVEAPRGELFYYVKSNGTAYPERVKVRTPTFANILSFIKIAKGGNIADVPVSFASLDPCFSCTDR